MFFFCIDIPEFGFIGFMGFIGFIGIIGFIGLFRVFRVKGLGAMQNNVLKNQAMTFTSNMPFRDASCLAKRGRAHLTSARNCDCVVVSHGKTQACL